MDHPPKIKEAIAPVAATAHFITVSVNYIPLPPCKNYKSSELLVSLLVHASGHGFACVEVFHSGKLVITLVFLQEKKA